MAPTRRPGGSAPISFGTAWVRANQREGVNCPCCGLLVREYRRRLHSGLARCAITLDRASRDTLTGDRRFVHAPSLPGDTHEVSQLAWWGLAEEEHAARDDGGRAGYWRITEMGHAWVHNRHEVPSHAYVIDGTVTGVDGDGLTCRKALGRRFNYEELMRA